VQRDPVSFRWFAEGRAKDTPDLTPLPADYSNGFRHGLQTQTGKIEFEPRASSATIRRRDRPPIMKYRPSWEGAATTELYAKYPIQMVSPHPRYSFHTHADGKDSTTSDIADHRVLVDGHYYWVMRLSAKDAATAMCATAT